jgi:anthranilate phosphoribosyltransferase
MQATKLASVIKEIGRGKNAAGDLNREDARALFAAMLADEVPDLQLGAVLMALRIKGESRISWRAPVCRFSCTV